MVGRWALVLGGCRRTSVTKSFREGIISPLRVAMCAGSRSVPAQLPTRNHQSYGEDLQGLYKKGIASTAPPYRCWKFSRTFFIATTPPEKPRFGDVR